MSYGIHSYTKMFPSFMTSSDISFKFVSQRIQILQMFKERKSVQLDMHLKIFWMAFILTYKVSYLQEFISVWKYNYKAFEWATAHYLGSING